MKITNVKGGINVDFDKDEMAEINAGLLDDGKADFDAAMQGVDFDDPAQVFQGLNKLFGIR